MFSNNISSKNKFHHSQYTGWFLTFYFILTYITLLGGERPRGHWSKLKILSKSAPFCILFGLHVYFSQLMRHNDTCTYIRANPPTRTSRELIMKNTDLITQPCGFQWMNGNKVEFRTPMTIVEYYGTHILCMDMVIYPLWSRVAVWQQNISSRVEN